MNVADAALAYAGAGWSVLALHSVDGEGACTCGSDKCKSPGKHPRADLCPRGFKDATTGWKTIAAWPSDINLGVALGSVSGNVMAFDIDDRAVAQALVHPNIGLTDQTGVVLTGRRGCHLWFRSTGPTATFHIKHADGRKLGEVRGDGAYVVVPPSLAQTGREYKWLGRSADDLIPELEQTADPLAYVVSLLKMVEIEIAPLAGQVDTQAVDRPTKVEAIPIPKALAKDGRLLEYRQLIAGGRKVGETDRSARLFRLGRALVEASADKGYALTVETFAGVIKMFDSTVFESPKYADRHNADRYYIDMAVREVSQNGVRPAQVAVSLPEPQTTESPSGTPPSTGQTGPNGPNQYFWDDKSGFLYRRGRQVQRVATFRPEILEDVEVDYGEVEHDRLWKVRLTQRGGKSHLLKLEAKETGQFALERALTKACDPDFMVYPGMYGHLRSAMQELSKDYVRVRAYATTGWIEHGDRWVYLLPGAAGALCAEGIDQAIRMERDYLPAGTQTVLDLLSAYGQGVRPTLNDGEREAAWSAFAALVEAGPPEKTLPIILQVLAGPLASAGIEAPPLVHVRGQTGTLKTSYCMAAASLFGRFTGAVPASWSSTLTSLQILLSTAKDMTLLVDDYKRSAAMSGKPFVGFINNYADRTGRLRAGNDQELRPVKVPRGLMLSNGEDDWESDASVGARTIVLVLSSDDITVDKLGPVQVSVEDGTLQLFGGTYLSWLAAQTALLDGSRFGELADRAHQTLLGLAKMTTIHLRMLRSLSTLVAVGMVVTKMLEEQFGDEAAARFKGWLNDAVRYLILGVRSQAVDVAETSPYNQLTRAIREGLQAGSICLASIKDDRRIPARARAEVVGFFGEVDGKTCAILTRDTTYAWFERQHVRRGQQTNFGWSSFLSEAAAQGGVRIDRKKVSENVTGRKQMRGMALPLDEVEGYGR